MKNRRKNSPAPAPDFLARQRESLRRNRRQVIYFNQMEMEAIEEYCRRFKIKSKSAVYRQSIVERILSGLDETHPTLF